MLSKNMRLTCGIASISRTRNYSQGLKTATSTDVQKKFSRHPFITAYIARCPNAALYTSFRYFSRARDRESKIVDLYRVLGIESNASPKEIKLAYFRMAKKYHPDINPNDVTAKAKFQSIAEAYGVLSDPVKRRIYDVTGSTSQQGHQYHQDASETFRTAQEDLDVLKDAFRAYTHDVTDEFTYAAESARR